jgi:uncharacterized DUF497 family protein
MITNQGIVLLTGLHFGNQFVEWESEAAAIGRIISARITTSFERRAYEDGEF